MKTFTTAQKLFSILFLAATFAAAAGNMWAQRRQLRDSMVGLLPPITEKDARADVWLLEDAVKTHITGKMNFVEAYAFIQTLMGKNEIDNFAYVKAKNGAVNFGSFYEADTSGLEKYADRLARMRDYFEKRGGGVVFLTPPDLYVWGNPEYDAGLPHRDANPMIDAFHDILRSRGVEFFDSRYALLDSGIPRDKIMYRTDHHWTSEACFEVFRSLVGRMETRFGRQLDPGGFHRNPANYGRRTYPASFLGFLGRSTGIHFSGMEDFTIIWPRFAGEYSVEYIDRFGYTLREGPTEQSLLFMDVLKPGDPYGMTMFDFYLCGIKTWAKVTNHNNPNGPKLLFIHDSFGPPLAAFLAPLFSEIHMMWPCAETFAIDIDKYIAERNFDFAVVELYPYNYNDAGMRFFVDAAEPAQTDDSVKATRHDDNNDIGMAAPR